MHVKIFHWAALPNAAAADTVVGRTDGGMVAYIFNIIFSYAVAVNVVQKRTDKM